MNSCTHVFVSSVDSVLDSIEIIDKGGLQIALVVDENQRLLGTVTDGDIRRALLRGVSLQSPVSEVMNPNPITAGIQDAKEAVFGMMKLKRIHHIPIVGHQGEVIRIDTLDGMVQSNDKDNWVVIMAGGLGTRLRPLTENCPKPLLRVGSKPLLETIIGNFSDYGFRKFYISVNYKSNMIKDYFGDGTRFGVQIKYLEESQRMGTAGALSLLPAGVSGPVIVMNGDLLTKVNFEQLVDFHNQQKALATMCVRDYHYQIPYGVVHMDGHKLMQIEEKPLMNCYVNAGIYVLDADVLQLVPRNTLFDMTTLFEKLNSLDCEAVVFPIREYWLDIGRRADFDKANEEFSEVFG